MRAKHVIDAAMPSGAPRGEGLAGALWRRRDNRGDHSRVGFVNAGPEDDLVTVLAGTGLVRLCDEGAVTMHVPARPTLCVMRVQAELAYLAREGWRIARWRCEGLGGGRLKTGPDGPT